MANARRNSCMPTPRAVDDARRRITLRRALKQQWGISVAWSASDMSALIAHVARKVPGLSIRFWGDADTTAGTVSYPSVKLRLEPVGWDRHIQTCR